MACDKFVCCGLILCILYFSNISAFQYHVPVLIWGSGLSTPGDERFSSLTRLHSNDFLDHFLKRVHTEKPPIIIFAENTLSVEDFSHQDAYQEGNFPNLKALKSSEKGFEFLPSVEQPVSALIGPEIKSYGYNTEEFSDEPLKIGTVYVLKLEDAQTKEDRPEMLRRHDKKISTIYKNLAVKSPNVVAVFTGQISSWLEPAEVTRVRRDANDTAGTVLHSNNTLLYSPKPPVFKSGEKEFLLVDPTTYSDDVRDTSVKANYAYPAQDNLKLRILFENSSTDWELTQIEYETSNENAILVPDQFIGAPFGRSYHVSGPVKFVNKTISLTFDEGLQVEPWLPEKVARFSYADDSTPFFTAPIWMGIFVMSLFGMIMMWALIMILDIRTMDQFDDPKGKTITVNVTD